MLIAFDNVPAIFLYHPPLKFYVSKKVKVADTPSIYYNHDRFLDFKDWDVN